MRERRDPRPGPGASCSARGVARSAKTGPQSILCVSECVASSRYLARDDPKNPNENISGKIAAVCLEARRQDGGREGRQHVENAVARAWLDPFRAIRALLGLAKVGNPLGVDVDGCRLDLVSLPGNLG